MTVDIDIDLSAIDAYHEIANLKVALKSLGDDLDIDFDLDGDLGDKLDDLSDTMGELSEAFTKDMNETIDRLEGLEFDDIMVKGGNGDSGGDTGSDSGDHIPSANQYFSGGPFSDDTDTQSGIAQALEKFHRNVDGLGLDGIATRLGVNSDSDDSAIGELLKGDMMDFQFLGGDGEPRLSPNLNAELDAETAKSLQSKIDSIFTQDDFEFQIDRDTTNREGQLYGKTNAGLMPWEDYQRVRGIEGDMDFGGDLPGSEDDSRRGRFRGLARRMKAVSGAIDGVTDGFKKMIPSMSTWINMVGMAVPALGAMAVQALGVASAFGAIALAGAGMVGLGLLGEGDTMAESMQNAQEEVANLKQDLFETFEPAADLFSGVQSEFFDFIPKELERVSGSMEGLLVFKDEFFQMFRGLTIFASDFFNSLSDNSNLISGLFEDFRGIIGPAIIDLFEFLLQAASDNEGMLKQLGGTLKTVAIALYEVFVMVSRALIYLSPLFTIIAWGAKLLNNNLVSGMLATLAVLYLLTSVLPAIYLGFQAMGFALQRSTIPALGSLMSAIAGYITQALVAIGINGALAASIAAVTTALLTLAAVSGIGLLISGAGLAGMGGMKSQMPDGTGQGSGGFGSAGGNVTNNYEGDTVNVDIGNADTSTVEKFTDMGSGGPRTPVEGSYGG